jgi:hypothetical protein
MIVLFNLYDVVGEVIPKKWVPWPFRKAIYGKPIKRDANAISINSTKSTISHTSMM